MIHFTLDSMLSLFNHPALGLTDMRILRFDPYHLVSFGLDKLFRHGFSHHSNFVFTLRDLFLDNRGSFLRIGNLYHIHQLSSSDCSEEDVFDDVLISSPFLYLSPDLVVTFFLVT